MLTETTLKHLKPKDAVYKVADRDGMYVTVSVVGTISFRFDYRRAGHRRKRSSAKSAASLRRRPSRSSAISGRLGHAWQRARGRCA